MLLFVAILGCFLALLTTVLTTVLRGRIPSFGYPASLANPPVTRILHYAEKANYVQMRLIDARK